MTGPPLRVHVIACPVFQQELELLAAEAQTDVTLRHLEMRLHEGSAGELRAALQSAIDEVAAGQCDAIAMGYGLCNRGILGLRARSLPVVIPRAHDCIGMLLGTTQCYLAQLERQPATYFQSPGWLENSPTDRTMRAQQMLFSPSAAVTRQELAAKYGEDNAEYLLEEFAKITTHYQRLAYIATPVPASARWEERAREIARQRGWTFERLEGELGWLRRLINAQWSDHEFLMLEPGQRVASRYDGQLIGAEPA